MASTITAAGSAALASLTSGTDNVALGTEALTATSSGSENVAVGSQAGNSNVSGDENVLIGYDVAPTLASGSSNIVIGASEDVPSSSTSNYLNIGGVITGDMSSGAITLADGFMATTQAPLDSSTKLATTAYVDDAVSAGPQGTVTTTGSPASGNLTKFSGASSVTNGDLSGDVTTSGTLVTTVDAIQGTTVSGTTGSGNVVFSASPALTGNPTAPTQSPGDNSTKIATTAYVDSAISGSGFSSIISQVFTSGGTYTPSVGMLYCTVEVLGAGGGGGYGVNTGAGGGGAGTYAKKTYAASSIGSSQTVTIGSAGSGGTSGSTNGGNGGTTSFGSLLSCPGGNGGIAPTAGAPSFLRTAGGAVASLPTGTYDVVKPGGPGYSGLSFTNDVGGTDYGCAWSGRGADSPYGSGGQDVASQPGSVSNVAGNSASGYGAGGSGAVEAATGGAGTGGLVIITEYCS